MGRFKPLEKILTNVVDTLGNKIGALPSPNVLFDEYNIALKNKMVSKIKGIVEDMPNTMNLPYEIGQKLNSEGKLPLPIGTSLLPSGRKGYPDEVHKIIGHKGNIYNPDLYGYEIQAPNGDIFFQAISDPKSGLREQRLDKVGSFTAALGPEGVAEMRFVPPSRPVRKSVERSQISEAEQKVIDLGALPSSNELYRFEKPKYRFSESKAIETSKLFKSVNKFPALSKSEETLVASSSAPVNEIAGLGRVKIEKIDPNDMAGSKKRFDELKALTSGYKQDRAKATIIRLENGENAIQYMQPPTEVKKLNISELIATQDNVVLGTNKTAGDVMPLVVKKDGKFFIRDGHHRIAQNINSGDKTADVRLIDLDKGGFLNPKRIGLDFDEQEVIIGNDKVGALPSSNFNDLRKGATIRIDNPPFLDAITNETYVAKKIRENNEFKKLYPSDDPIGTVSGVTGFANNVKFSPQELIGIKGHAGEEKYRESGRRMELLKESIAKEGYRDADKGGERILIHVREDGVPFITEGNHRMVEAFQSNRPFISADVRYLRGAEEVDGLLNPKRIGLDFGEE